jgi:hypothetical protein
MVGSTEVESVHLASQASRLPLPHEPHKMERQTGLEPACICFADSCLASQHHWRVKITNVLDVSKDWGDNTLSLPQPQYATLFVAHNKAAVQRSTRWFEVAALQLEW